MNGCVSVNFVILCLAIHEYTRFGIRTQDELGRESGYWLYREDGVYNRYRRVLFALEHALYCTERERLGWDKHETKHHEPNAHRVLLGRPTLEPTARHKGLK